MARPGRLWRFLQAKTWNGKSVMTMALVLVVVWPQRATRIRSIFSTMMERIAVQFTCRMHHEMGWTAFSTSPTSLVISRCAGLTECRLLSRSENSRRSADQAAGVSNPAFIRTHMDECGKCPDEVDNQGNNAVLPGTALVWTLTTTSQSTLISSRDAHGQISDAGAWRTFEIYWTSKTTTHTACSPTAKTRWLSTMRSETA